jgi:peptidoglycan/xylan/chitin deacetylase (PgdA/CDA1 family)
MTGERPVEPPQESRLMKWEHRLAQFAKRLVWFAPSRLIDYVPLSLGRALIHRQRICAVYHVVSNERLPYVHNLYPFKTPEMFERDLLYLKEHFQLLSYDQFVAGQRGDADISQPALMITIDDGYAECFTIVRPLLLKHGIPCTFFVVCDWVDNARLFYRNKISLCLEQVRRMDDVAWSQAAVRVCQEFDPGLHSRPALIRWAQSLNGTQAGLVDRLCEILAVDAAGFLAQRKPYLTLEQVRQLTADGFTIGGHSVTHTRLELLNSQQITQEIVQSCAAVRDWTGQASVPFAFPFGGQGVSRDLLKRIRDEHPWIGLIFDSGWLGKDRDFVVNRVPFDITQGADTGTNIPLILRRAYREQLKHNLLRLLGRCVHPFGKFPAHA